MDASVEIIKLGVFMLRGNFLIHRGHINWIYFVLVHTSKLQPNRASKQAG